MMNIKLFQKQVGTFTLKAFCLEAFEEQMDWLLGDLGEIIRNREFDDRFIVHIVWTLLILKKQGNEITVYEPDYKNNPFENLKDDLTLTMSIFMDQTDLIKKLNVEGEQVRFDQKIILEKNCLINDEVYLERISVDDPNDSGWFIGSTKNGKVEVENLETMYLYELLITRYKLMQVLLLPAGSLVVFDQDNIVEILDQNNKSIYVD